ncbi:uncharacterized protein FIBRA_07488 [Fibroporia radiculosa]|uniref:Heterokaryon incompatibility domain-containing protein n=1 Tax=Fibroporia radiculosa TaxID=599839 RepID=J4IBU6_9APHY|nr:uncharacterized protein FIBRA_07488 [Fibroporia radiculosa]CCM05276.1 predicted protein [Fibroporia radiculosa]
MSIDVNNALTQHIFNNMPIHLIYIREFRLMDRASVKDHLQVLFSEETIQQRCKDQPDDSRETVITSLLNEHARYAILSHRWLNKEPTYQEMLMSHKPPDAGFLKLKQFCEAASKYGIEFAWSDTCCIDKASSSELDESIRSMYRWYQNAAICLTFLADTTAIDNLQQDEWFTRGWTLQELLAPKKVKFFGKGWVPLTNLEVDLDKDMVYERRSRGESVENPVTAQMLDRLASATGIDSFDLVSFYPGSSDVPKRMVWAAKRRVTRGEDRAYSLMGMFGVSLSIAYGEGADQAFFRLMDAIIQISEDPAVLDWAGMPAFTGHPSQMLPSLPDCYLGYTDSMSGYSVSFGKEPFALTNRGLRIAMLILPITVANVTPYNTVVPQATFHCRSSKWIEDTVVHAEGPFTVSARNTYAIGIWGSGFIDGGSHRCFGCLLTRHGRLPGIYQSDGWSKMVSRSFIVLTPSGELINPDLTSLHPHLETIYV